MAKTLVQQRLVACVNVLPGITSVYWWQGAVQTDAEVLLVMKTTTDRLADLQTAVQTLHPYDVPEFVALPIDHVSPAYGQWLADSVAQAFPDADTLS
jgi:periplasmic divalent cation tolerance protein